MRRKGWSKKKGGNVWKKKKAMDVRGEKESRGKMKKGKGAREVQGEDREDRLKRE